MAKEGIPGADRAKPGVSTQTSACPDEMTLASYLDGKLNEDGLARMESHLANCGKCRKAVDELREILTQMDTIAEDPRAVSDVAAKAKKLIDR